MDFYVFDLHFNFYGVIDDYISIPLTRNYTKKTNFIMDIAPTERNLNLLKKDRLITKSSDLQHAYIIDTIEFNDSTQNEGVLRVTAYSLHHLLKKRIVYGQQTFSGSIGQVMSNFVDANAVNPSDIKRFIPSLVISPENNIGSQTSEGTSYQYLDEYLFEIANKHGISWDILFDYENKNFVFKVWKGIDRSELQSSNPRVVFAKEFDNVVSQNYISSNGDYKTVAIVAGEGEGAYRKIVTINDFSGFERDELFVDARDLQSTYSNENGQEVTMPEAEYVDLLIERGNNKLTENQKIETLDSELELDASFKFGEDYQLGDIVSIKNTKLGLAVHTRLTETVETYGREGRSLKVDFGSNIPTLIEKLKKLR